MESATPAASAQPEPKTQSAIAAAVASGDVRAFRQASHAERLGKPLADVAIAETPAETKPTITPVIPGRKTQPARTNSKRQEKTNDVIREAVQRAVQDREKELRQEAETREAELRAENARLKGQAPVPSQPGEDAQPNANDYKRYLALPDAPKLEAFDSIPEFTAAMFAFMAKTDAAERSSRTAAQTINDSKQKRIDSFVGQLQAARTADPQFVTKLSPVVRDRVKPFDALKRDEKGNYLEMPSSLNVIGEHVYDSTIAPKILIYLSEHDDELRRLAAVPQHLMHLPESARAAEHTKWITKEFGKLEGKLSTDAPAEASPAETPLVAEIPDPPSKARNGATEPNDPQGAAVKRGDVRTFRKLELEKRLAKTRR